MRVLGRERGGHAAHFGWVLEGCWVRVWGVGGVGMIMRCDWMGARRGELDSGIVCEGCR